MTRKTPRYGWTVKGTVTIAAVCVAVVFALGVALSPPRSPSVAAIGDRAHELRDALGATDQSDAATVTFVLINRWDSLQHLPDIAELCWDACHNREAGHIALTHMRFGQTRKVVVFHLPSFEGDMACIAQRAQAELAALHARAVPCHASAPRTAVYVLPLGLGRLS
ncbi:hypothetical protein [Sulfitobacter sp. S190]|uniref:hypothetical protein n=1 Tax=Sulfitobacter sp. S190 TaxID=2867022 RepID=UPI0021A7E24F|nr:hypothetical protein [Sulfitobacter sp. S190]UWR21793.1 hypothetical protein K3756_14020 [Sulfitobacter sp. S190]